MGLFYLNGKWPWACSILTGNGHEPVLSFLFYLQQMAHVPILSTADGTRSYSIYSRWHTFSMNDSCLDHSSTVEYDRSTIASACSLPPRRLLISSCAPSIPIPRHAPRCSNEVCPPWPAACHCPPPSFPASFAASLSKHPSPSPSPKLGTPEVT